MSDALATVVGDRSWAWLRQEHGTCVQVVRRPGEHAGEPGDGLVTKQPGIVVSVRSADCALVALGSPEGVTGVAHAGWRGAVAGVVEATVDAMRRQGATQVLAWRGACIHPCCYPFEEPDLAAAADRLGDGVVGRARDGSPAFDLPRAVRIGLERAGALLVGEDPSCTGCDEGWFSWRVRGDSGRVVVGAWCEP